MSLGNFSISLSVKNLKTSKEFYEKLGFQQIFGDETQGWLILSNGDCKIGLFQGMFEKNTLTFNPGWDKNGDPIGEFEDIRKIQKRLKAAGMEFVSEADETTSGPASLVIVDPDGNPILLDQHL